MQGGVLQDFGREPVRISFEGIIFGENAIEFLERIRSKYKAGAPVPFSSDLSGVAEVTQVLIEELQVEEVGGRIHTYNYWMVLREYTPPPEEEAAAPSQEEDAQEDVEEETDDALGSVNYITGKVLDTRGNPKADIPVKITWDEGEITIKTNEKGVYRKDNLEPGKYIVAIDAEGYKGMEKEVIIKPGKEKAEVKEKEAEEKPEEEEIEKDEEAEEEEEAAGNL